MGSNISRPLPLSAYEQMLKERFLQTYGSQSVTTLLQKTDSLLRIKPVLPPRDSKHAQTAPADAALSHMARQNFCETASSSSAFSNTGMVIRPHERYFPVRMHTHIRPNRAFYEMLCVLHGTLPHRVGSELRILQPGDVILFSPGCSHAFLSFSDDSVIYNIGFLSDRFAELLQPMLHHNRSLAEFYSDSVTQADSQSYLSFHTGSYFQQSNRLMELIDLWETQPAYLSERLTACTQLFLFDLLEMQEQAAPQNSLLTNDKDHQLITYIRSNLSTVTVENIAKNFHYSTRQIRRIFKKSTGVGCMDYIQQCRMEQFVQLLETDSADIHTLLEQCGISATSQFYARFHAQFGTTPAEYRKTFQQNAASGESA